MAYSNNEKPLDKNCGVNYDIKRDMNDLIVLKPVECAQTIRLLAIQQIIDDSFKIMKENAVKMKCQFFINIINECLLEDILVEWTNREIKYEVEKIHVLIGDKESIKINLSWEK